MQFAFEFSNKYTRKLHEREFVFLLSNSRMQTIQRCFGTILIQLFKFTDECREREPYINAGWI